MSSKNKSNLINPFLDILVNCVVFDLMDPSLPAWNYSISGKTGSGKSLSKSPEEIYEEKLKQENSLFDHFLDTGEVIEHEKV